MKSPPGRKRPIDRPETVRQAKTWEGVKNEYVIAGLCNGCAGQAAYGHQLGFHKIHSPGLCCAGKTLPESVIDRHGSRAVRWLAGEFTAPSEDVT